MNTKTIYLNIIGLILIQFVISCGHTQYIPLSTSYESIEKIPCTRQDSLTRFFTFYNGEELNFKYKTLGHLTSQNGNMNEGNPLEILKANAVSQCADGIVNLNRSSSNGTYTYTSYNYEKNSCTKKYDYVSSTSNHNYFINQYSALAVKLYDSLLSPRQDTSFISRYNKQKTNPIYVKHEENYALQIIGAVLSIPLAILLYSDDK